MKIFDRRLLLIGLLFFILFKPPLHAAAASKKKLSSKALADPETNGLAPLLPAKAVPTAVKENKHEPDNKSEKEKIVDDAVLEDPAMAISWPQKH